jgi:CheY-like chemotaxis protein
VRPKARVLVADDEAASLRLACATIGCDPRLDIVASCEDGPSVLATLERDAVDVAVIDIRMPGIDGRGLARVIA